MLSTQGLYYTIGRLKARVLPPYLVDVTFVVVHVQYAEQLCVTSHS